jgi:NADH:ubiquinone oxidoreductase subunit 4 (subunit M)
MLWLVQLTFFGRLREPILEGHGDHSPPGDLNAREILALSPILILIVWIGINPQFFTSRMEPSINQVVQRLQKAAPRYANSSPVREGRVTAGIDEKRTSGVAGEATAGSDDIASKD